MGMKRRDFLEQAVLSGVALALGPAARLVHAQQVPTTVPLRRDIASLSANDDILVAFKTAISAMQALPDSDGRNWRRQAQIHLDFCPHGNWLFLPWHRAYLFYFERICRRLSGMDDFALPYWDWSRSPTIPAPFWGEENNPLFVPDRVATPRTTTDSLVVGTEALENVLRQPDFQLFGSAQLLWFQGQRAQVAFGTLEGSPHNYIHGFVGGIMENFLAPLDPIFWAHHNMVERCWVEWNLRGNLNGSSFSFLQRTFTEFYDENGTPVRVTVADMMSLPGNAYAYERIGTGAQSDREIEPQPPEGPGSPETPIDVASTDTAVDAEISSEPPAPEPQQPAVASASPAAAANTTPDAETTTPDSTPEVPANGSPPLAADEESPVLVAGLGQASELPVAFRTLPLSADDATVAAQAEAPPAVNEGDISTLEDNLDFVQSVSTEPNSLPTVARPAVFDITVPTGSPTADTGNEWRWVLALHDVHLAHTRDYQVRISLRDPNAFFGLGPAIHAGSIAFFSHEHEGASHHGLYYVDVTEALRSLNLSGTRVRVEMTLVPFGIQGWLDGLFSADQRPLQFTSAELALIRATQ